MADKKPGSPLAKFIMGHYHNHDLKQLVCGAAALPFPTPDPAKIPKVEAIQVQALSTNTKPIFCGYTGVLADGSTGGWELPPGGCQMLTETDYTLLLAISSIADQRLQITYMYGPY